MRDALDAAPPTSWANSVLTSFADSTTYACLAVPQRIKMGGYVVFNNAAGTINSRADQGAIPLRCSTDPITVFLIYCSKRPIVRGAAARGRPVPHPGHG